MRKKSKLLCRWPYKRILKEISPLILVAMLRVLLAPPMLWKFVIQTIENPTVPMGRGTILPKPGVPGKFLHSALSN